MSVHVISLETIKNPLQNQALRFFIIVCLLTIDRKVMRKFSLKDGHL